MRIAFHAPMKPPDDPRPSGDRRMAQLLTTALTSLGHAVESPSRMRTYLPAPDPASQNWIRTMADAEAERITDAWASEAARPDLWFTYHNYHKAPDLLGPALARRFRLPYVVVEASRATKRAAAWSSWFDAADTAIAAADAHLCFTSRDRAGILPLAKPGATTIDLPPFIDIRAFPAARDRRPTDAPTLVAVAMMRPGDKLASFTLLAEALTPMQDDAWRLLVVGDGPARDAVERLFAAIDPARIAWAGALPEDAVLRALDGADIYVWPGLGEAFGMSYLEAQAMGLPVAALDTAGVSSVVRHEVTGLLAKDASAAAFAAVLRRLCRDAAMRTAMGRAAARWVRSERTLERASLALSDALAVAMEAGLTHA